MESNIYFIIVVSASIFLMLSIFIIVLIATFYRKLQRKQLEMLKAVIETQENEQQRIGRDLHDGTGVLLSLIKFEIEKIKLDASNKNDFDKMQQLHDESMHAIRAAAYDLVPSTLNKFGLIDALVEIKEKVENEKLKVVIRYPGTLFNINRFAATNLYRIILELINNCLKHASASFIEIEFTLNEKSLGFSFFSKQDTVFLSKQAKKGIGQLSIESRVNMLNGKLRIEHNSEGLKYEFAFPLDELIVQ